MGGVTKSNTFRAMSLIAVANLFTLAVYMAGPRLNFGSFWFGNLFGFLIPIFWGMEVVALEIGAIYWLGRQYSSKHAKSRTSHSATPQLRQFPLT